VSADPSKLFVLSAVMAQEDYLGWSRSRPTSGRDIFIDDKSIGAVGKTPLSQNIKPGKHTFWISTEGYDEYKEEVEVIAGETHAIKASLKGAPVGKLNVIASASRTRRSTSTVRSRASAGRASRPCSRAITS